MNPLSTRAAHKKTLSNLLSYSRQCLPRPARLYSTPTKRASAPTVDPVTPSIPHSYPAFLPALPTLADPTGNVQGDSNTRDLRTFLPSRPTYTILPTPLPRHHTSDPNH